MYDFGVTDEIRPEIRIAESPVRNPEIRIPRSELIRARSTNHHKYPKEVFNA